MTLSCVRDGLLAWLLQPKPFLILLHHSSRRFSVAGKFCDLLKRKAVVAGISEMLIAFRLLRPTVELPSAIGTAVGVGLQNLPQVIFVTTTHVAGTNLYRFRVKIHFPGSLSTQ